jgi:hypothetical protein
MKKTQDQFIQEAKSIHNDFYNYSKVIYTKSCNKIIIICPKHGDFIQEANSHLQGHGCKKCQAENARVPKDEGFDKKSYMKTYNKDYREKNKEKFKKYSQSNIEQKRVNRRNSYHKNKNKPHFKLRRILSKRLYYCLKNINKKKPPTMELLGCSIEELKVYIEKQFKNGMTWENYGQWHIDHIKPCASFDLTNDAQVKICFHYTNLQPLWASENCSKWCHID